MCLWMMSKCSAMNGKGWQRLTISISGSEKRPAVNQQDIFIIFLSYVLCISALFYEIYKMHLELFKNQRIDDEYDLGSFFLFRMCELACIRKFIGIERSLKKNNAERKGCCLVPIVFGRFSGETFGHLECCSSRKAWLKDQKYAFRGFSAQILRFQISTKKRVKLNTLSISFCQSQQIDPLYPPRNKLVIVFNNDFPASW